MAGTAKAEEIRLVALGDSLTQGYGLAAREGLVPQLNAWLKAQGAAITVINAGVSGDTTAGGRARALWSFERGADGVIVALGHNDMLRGIDPTHSRANLAAILALAGDLRLPVLLVGVRATGNYGPDYQRAFDAIYPELAQAFGTLYQPSFFAEDAVEDPVSMMPLLQGDRLHPNQAGIAHMVKRLGPNLLRLGARIRQQRPPE